MIQNVLESPPPMLSSTYFSTEFCDFLQSCLQKQPLDRVSADVLLESPWLQRCGAVSKCAFVPLWVKKVEALGLILYFGARRPGECGARRARVDRSAPKGVTG